MTLSLPPLLPEERRQAQSQLRVLVALHYVHGALQALCTVLLGAFLAYGIRHEQELNAIGQDAEKHASGQALIVFLAIMLTLAVASTALQFFAAEGMRRQRWLPACMICAGWNCLWLPLGTALGVGSLLVLLRSQTMQLFREPPQ